jgi:multiple sugar transport system ATP-binding protein
VSGGQLVMPLATMLLDDPLRRRIDERQLVIVGIRPEMCHDANALEGRDVQDRIEFTTRIDDVEWRGKTQLVYFGYEVEPEIEEMLTDIEDSLDFDLFSNFVVAELSASTDLRAGMSARIVVPRTAIHVFDAQTGENLTQD